MKFQDVYSLLEKKKHIDSSHLANCKIEKKNFSDSIHPMTYELGKKNFYKKNKGFDRKNNKRDGKTLFIHSLFENHKDVKEGSLFVAIKGLKEDGHKYVQKAFHQGAKVVVVESSFKKNLNALENFKESDDKKIICVKDSRKALSTLSALFYNFPSEKLFTIGITGTNGKTTVSFMVECIFSKFFKTGVIGSIDHHLGKEKKWESSLTTPGALELQRRFSEFKNEGAKVTVMEVSSHAIHQKRVSDVSFNALVFTHFSRDHLDYHGTMEDYFSSKESLFNLEPSLMNSMSSMNSTHSKNSKKEVLVPSPLGIRPMFVVLNRDDPLIRTLKILKGVRVITYGKKCCGKKEEKEKGKEKREKWNEATKRNEKKRDQRDHLENLNSLESFEKMREGKNLNLSFSHFSFDIKKKSFSSSTVQVESPEGEILSLILPCIGEHNVYNALSAIAIGWGASIALKDCVQALQSFSGVPGRLQKVKNTQGIHVFVDYAHTEASLDFVLKCVNEIKKSFNRESKASKRFGEFESKEEPRILTLFGCGGDRDKGKRPSMMRVAYQNSDQVFLTSDNPRSEDPIKIINECLSGLRENEGLESAGLKNVDLKDIGLKNEGLGYKVKVVVDRKEAIFSILKEAREGDIVLIAGKGHEKFQITKEGRKPFDDVKVAQEFFS